MSEHKNEKDEAAVVRIEGVESVISRESVRRLIAQRDQALADLSACQREHEANRQLWKRCMDAKDQALAEVERLRAALERIVGFDVEAAGGGVYDEWAEAHAWTAAHDIARQALSPNTREASDG